MSVIAWVLVVVVIANSLLILHRNQAPKGFILWFPKLFSGVFSVYAGIIGLLGTLVGFYVRSLAVILLSAVGVMISAWYIRAVSKPHDGFERAFGKDWETTVTENQKASILPRR